MKKIHHSILTLAIATMLPICAQAQLKITEVESSEASGSFPTADWFELSNFGTTTIDILGDKMDDNSSNFLNSVSLTGVTNIAAGESVVFFETTGTTLTPTDFSNWWGPNLNASLQIGTYSGSGVGLGGSGDEVNLFDSAGNPVDGVIFGSATSGTTFVFDNGDAGRSPTGLSQVGVNGAFTSENGDIGSPGVVPEPSTFALAGFGAAALFGFYRNKKK